MRGIEAPVDPRPLDQQVPAADRVVVCVKVPRHERVGRHRPELLDRAPRADEAQQFHEQFGRFAHLVETAVGDDQRQFHAAAPLPLDLPIEDRFEVRRQPLQARTDDHDLVRLQIVELDECVQNRIVDRLRLSRQAVAAVDRERVVVSRIVLLLHRLAGGRDCLLHPGQERGRFGGCAGSGRNAGLGDDALRAEEHLRLAGAVQPGGHERVEVVG